MPTLTITTTVGEASRVIAALGRELQLNDNGVLRSATEAEVKAWVIAGIKAMVYRQERAAIVEQAAIASLDPT